MFSKMEYILAVYRERSFTKAAEKLYISQPCLSSAVKKIEEKIGSPIFERRYSGLRVTETGMEYIRTAERIKALENDFAKYIGNFETLISGSITVGGSNYVSSYIIPSIVSEFAKLYPGVKINLVEAGSVDLEKKLAAEELDIAIDSFDSEKDGLECIPLISEKILLAVPASRPCNKSLEKFGLMPGDIYESADKVSRMPEIPIEYFKEEKFILLKSGHNMQYHAAKVFEAAGIVPEVTFRLDQLLTSYSLCSSGLGACFVTDSLFRHHRFRDNVLLYNIKSIGARNMYIFSKKNRHVTPAMEKFTLTAQKVYTYN